MRYANTSVVIGPRTQLGLAAASKDQHCYSEDNYQQLDFDTINNYNVCEKIYRDDYRVCQKIDRDDYREATNHFTNISLKPSAKSSVFFQKTKNKNVSPYIKINHKRVIAENERLKTENDVLLQKIHQFNAGGDIGESNGNINNSLFGSLRGLEKARSTKEIIYQQQIEYKVQRIKYALRRRQIV